jgi:alpha-ribazole phosphatase
MRLYLVRHPKPQVAADVCYGSTDLAVAEQELRRALFSLLPDLPQGVPLFSSPLQRCAELADRIAAAYGGAAVTYDARLAEMHFGAWELRPWRDIARAEIDAWADDLIGYRPGGGENVLQMAQRVRAFHDDVMRLPLESAIVVCHAGTIRLLLACRRALPLAGMALYAAQMRHQINYGEVIRVDW